MSRIAQVTKQLEVERDRIERELERLTAAIDALNAASRDHFGRATKPRRAFSAATRARMAAVQRARWAKTRKQSAVRRPKRMMSKSARNRIAAAQRARWAKLKQKQLPAKPRQKKST